MLPVRMLSTAPGIKDPLGDSECPQLPEVVEALLRFRFIFVLTAEVHHLVCSQVILLFSVGRTFE